ncbi:hypothetical protein ACFFVB_01150 [Formosa undariae]|uniref:Uncharacterized protein n=1 Tax=Formosa undariae TaxID=1325436 RepID=A0ABV5EWX6_9FLAO
MKPNTKKDIGHDKDTEFVKDKENPTRNYIFQKDKITKRTSLFVLILLLILVAAVAMTSIFLE